MPTPSRIRSPMQSVIQPSADRDGRWNVYTGSEVMPNVEGLNNGEPVRVAFDLSTMTPAKDRIIALRDHENSLVVGYWDNFEITPDGLLIDLHLTRAADPIEAVALSPAIELAAHIRSGVPLEASIGIEPGPDGSWEEVPADGTVTVNGRTLSGSGDFPLYVLRGGIVTETSILSAAADRDTGKVSARRAPTPKSPALTTPKESPMSEVAQYKARVRALCAKYPEKHHDRIRALCSESDKDPTDEEVASKVQAAEMDELKAKCAALEQENTGLKQQLADGKPAEAGALRDGNDKNGDGVTDRGNESKPPETDWSPSAKAAAAASGRGVRFAQPTATAGKKDETAPADLVEAMQLVAKETKLVGAHLRAEARRRYPDLPNVSPARAARVAKRMVTG